MFQSQQYGRLSMDDPDSTTDGPQEFHRAALYILGDKTQMKVMYNNCISSTGLKYIILLTVFLTLNKGHER